MTERNITAALLRLLGIYAILMAVRLAVIGAEFAYTNIGLLMHKDWAIASSFLVPAALILGLGVFLLMFSGPFVRTILPESMVPESATRMVARAWYSWAMMALGGITLATRMARSLLPLVQWIASGAGSVFHYHPLPHLAAAVVHALIGTFLVLASRPVGRYLWGRAWIADNAAGTHIRLISLCRLFASVLGMLTLLDSISIMLLTFKHGLWQGGRVYYVTAGGDFEEMVGSVEFYITTSILVIFHWIIAALLLRRRDPYPPRPHWLPDGDEAVARAELPTPPAEAPEY